VLDSFLEDESLFGEFLRTPVSKGGVEPLVVGLFWFNCFLWFWSGSFFGFGRGAC
jgi:hypothetical protein